MFRRVVGVSESQDSPETNNSRSLRIFRRGARNLTATGCKWHRSAFKSFVRLHCYLLTSNSPLSNNVGSELEAEVEPNADIYPVEQGFRNVSNDSKLRPHDFLCGKCEARRKLSETETNSQCLRSIVVSINTLLREVPLNGHVMVCDPTQQPRQLMEERSLQLQNQLELTKSC